VIGQLLGGAIDAALDRTVVPGYTRLGYDIRRLGWTHPELPSLAGRTVAVTGATSGIGRAAAQAAAAQGARLRLLVRDSAAGERAAREIAASTDNDGISVAVCDLASVRSIRACAAALAREQVRLDVLINNAGVLSRSRELSRDGYELTFATNVLGPFLLTALLAPLLGRAAPGRVITVTSGGMYTQRLRVEDLEMKQDGYDGTVAYARAKRAQMILTELWAERLASRRIAAHAMHPGWVKTPGVETSLPRFNRLLGPALRAPEEGADTIVWLAGAPANKLGSGRLWHDRRSRPVYVLPKTRESEQERGRLWSLLSALTGTT
jgi:NAD(P)-dependent dehydrogenase (short-subunit alcohol dehydrogenase family)